MRLHHGPARLRSVGRAADHRERMPDEPEALRAFVATTRKHPSLTLPPPLTHPVDVVLHVGMRKTGTSSIQFFLRDNREPLASRGVLYPTTPGRARHYRLSLSVKSHR